MLDVLSILFSQKLNKRLALHNRKELTLLPLTFLGVLYSYFVFALG